MVKIDNVADGTFNFKTPVNGITRVLSVYVIKDRENVLIDPGPASAVPQVKEAIGQLGINDIAYIIPTHIHLDHAGSIGEIIKFFPGAKVLLHPSAIKHMAEPSRLIESTRMVFGEDFEDSWGTIPPVPEANIRAVADGEKVPLGGRDIRVWYAPGHAPHHVAIFDEKTRGVFSGEALGVPRPGAENFPLPAIVPPSHDNDVFLGTIKKLEALKPDVIFYGHDGVGKEPEKLIPTVYENTRVFGEIVLKALKEGASSRDIGERIQAYITEKTGVKAEFSDRTMTVVAFTQYFKRKGLI